MSDVQVPNTAAIKGLVQLSRGTTIAVIATIAAIATAPPAAGQGGALFQNEFSPDSAVLTTRTVTLTWQNVSLRVALKRLSTAADVPIFLDRRIDPTQPVTLSAKQATAADVLDKLTGEISAAVTSVGPLFYIGPQSTCASLRTVAAVRAQQAAELPTHRRSRFSSRGNTVWPHLTEPRGLISKLVSDAGLELLGGERIPHDLWPAGQLPELTLAARLTVLLAGFEQTFAIRHGGRAVEIVPLDVPPAFRASYEVLAQHGVQLRELQRQLPTAEMSLEDGKLTLEGRWEDHQRLQQLLQSATRSAQPHRRRRTETRQVLTLRVENQPIGHLMDQLAQRLDLDVTWDERTSEIVGESRDVRVSFAVDGVDLDGLLKAVLHPVGLTFRRDGRQVEIVVRE